MSYAVSVFGEMVANDAVNRGEIEVSGNTEASYPDERNGRTPERSTAISIDENVRTIVTTSYQFETTDNETSTLVSQYTTQVVPANGTAKTSVYQA